MDWSDLYPRLSCSLYQLGPQVLLCLHMKGTLDSLASPRLKVGLVFLQKTLMKQLTPLQHTYHNRTEVATSSPVDLSQDSP